MSDTPTPDTTVTINPEASPTAPATPAPASSDAEVLVADLATKQLASLTESQRAAVKNIAGDDPVRVLKAISSLQPTWTAPPKDTAPVPSAPRERGTATPPDLESQWRELQATNPVLAARFALAHNVFGNR